MSITPLPTSFQGCSKGVKSLSMILIPVCILRVLQIDLDLIVHLFIHVFTASTNNDTHNAKGKRGIGNVLDAFLVCALDSSTIGRNHRCRIVFCKRGVGGVLQEARNL